MQKLTLLLGALFLCFQVNLNAQILFVPAAGIGSSSVPGNIGIGVSAPLTTLDVRGDNIFLSPPGTATLPGSPVPGTFTSLGEGGGGAPIVCDLYGFRSQFASPVSGNTQVDFVNLGVQRGPFKPGGGRPTLSFGSERIFGSGPISLIGPDAVLDIIAKNDATGSGCGNLIAQYRRPGSTGFIFPTPSSAIPSFTVYGKIVTSSNYFLSSDIRYKQDIEDLASANDIVDALRPVTYTHRVEEFPEMGFSSDLTYGFIAQEMEDVVPTLVHEDEDGFRHVNYVGLIPVLTASIKEQKEIIAAQQEQIDQLKAAMVEAGVLDGDASTPSNGGKNTLQGTFGEAKLYQNSPNPFNAETTIRYELPRTAQTAQMMIFDMQGREVRNYKLDNNGKLTINSGELESGMYLYSLIIDGQEVSTKRMILTK